MRSQVNTSPTNQFFRRAITSREKAGFRREGSNACPPRFHGTARDSKQAFRSVQRCGNSLPRLKNRCPWCTALLRTSVPLEGKGQYVYRTTVQWLFYRHTPRVCCVVSTDGMKRRRTPALARARADLTHSDGLLVKEA